MKKVKIKLNHNEIADLIWLLTSDYNPAFISESRVHLMLDPFVRVHARLQSNKWKDKYTLSLSIGEASALYIILYANDTVSGSSIWNTQRRVMDEIDKVHGYSTSEKKVYEKFKQAKKS